MSEEDSSGPARPAFFGAVLVLFFLLIPGVLAAGTALDTSVENLEIASVSSGGGLANGGSFYAYTSHDGRFVTFESLATNLTTEPSGSRNYSDVYLRDRLTDKTYKVSKSHDGGLTDEASLDPTITADGRYVAYFSYASNIVANDTNGKDWERTGLDVFVWDVQTRQNIRVSLDENGKEIDASSVGSISADGKYILFMSAGRVLTHDFDSDHRKALYLRDWHSGQIERISFAMNGGFPNAAPLYATISVNNRYVAYASNASNLVANDANHERDVFLYDRQTGTTKLISRDGAGRPANGRSSQPVISLDGKIVTFMSFASNLVPGDTNDATDIFVYDVDSEKISLVSRGENGALANGSSREPSVCGESRFISYTTEATNLFANDNNNERDVILYDRVKGTNIVATVNWQGTLGNGRAHRSFLAPDCRSIAYASDASNLVPGDNNDGRDIFIGDIVVPADFGSSNVIAEGAVEPGDVITYSFQVLNDGFVSGTAVLVSQIPTNTTFLTGSASSGAIYNAGDNRIEWQGTVDGSSQQVVSFGVVVDPSLVDPTVVTSESLLTGDGHSYAFIAKTIVNGYQTHLPLVSRK